MLDIAANSEDTRRIFLINLTGRIDSGTARDFDEFFRDLTRKGHRFLVLEAAGLEFVSSAGIASLVSLTRKLHSLGGAAAFLRLNDEIRMVLEFFGLARELPAFESVKEARDYLNSRAHNKNLSLELKQTAMDAGEKRSEEAKIESPAVKQDAGRVDGPRPLGAAAESAGTAAVPIQSMEADDLQLMIRRGVREVLREEKAGAASAGAPAASPAPQTSHKHQGEAKTDATKDATTDEKTGEKTGETTDKESGLSGAAVAAGAGLLGAAAGAVAATALSRGDSSPPGAGAKAGNGIERMSSPPPQAIARKSDKNSDKAIDKSSDGAADRKSDKSPEKKRDKKPVKKVEKKAPRPMDGGQSPADTAARGAAKKPGPEPEKGTGLFAEPRLIKCEQCGEQLRVARRGNYLCPSCGVKIRVRADGTAAFLERL